MIKGAKGINFRSFLNYEPINLQLSGSIQTGFMEHNKNEISGKDQHGKKDYRKMTRNEALHTIGTVAAGLPLITTCNYMKSNQIDYLSPSERRLLKDPILEKAVGELEYLTPADKFIIQRRGNPVLSEISDDKLAGIGLTPETWKLEIISDPESNSEIINPLSIEQGNAFDWKALMKLAETRSVRFLHVLTCTNAQKLYGMGLWEGVPLRDVFWMVKPKQNIRRLFFSGYHNNDPKQNFKASLPISRVLEEAPGELPVILCYKLNGKYLSQAIGGPVRLFVPGMYSNRSIKWLQRVTVTNSFHANDTYAEGNNDVEGPVKTCARFIHTPEKVHPGKPFAVTGFAQVGYSGLSKIQYWLYPEGQTMSDDDPYLTKGEWRDAMILPPPANWGSDMPGGKLPQVIQFDRKTNQPVTWPITNTIVHWAAMLKVEGSGKYILRCRSIDLNGIAQPMPRPFGRSGTNKIDLATITSESD